MLSMDFLLYQLFLYILYSGSQRLSLPKQSKHKMINQEL